MNRFSVTFHVDENKLPLILEVVAKSATLVGVSVVKEVEPKPPGKKSFHYANGLRNKGISGENLILELIKSGPVSFELIKDKFFEKGFASNSASAALSALRSKKIADRKADGSIFKLK